VEDTAKLIEAMAKLIGALAWPMVIGFGLFLFRLSTLSEFRFRGHGFEVSTVRRFDFDATSQKLLDYWKPTGTIDRANAARINTCMKQLGINGSVTWLMNAATPDERARVIACLSI